VVLAPISKQGQTVIDDGKQRIEYRPDDQLLIIQDSPLRSLAAGDAERRYRLVYRNYNVAAEGRARVANRDAQRVLLTPKAKSMGFARRYWIDLQTAVLLKVEWIDPSGKKQVMSDTISISYPKSLPQNTFEKTFVGQPKEVHIRAPARQTDLVKLSSAVGFAVVNPHDMPFGYLFIGADSIRARNGTMAAMRYTDGATNVTVYQARAASGQPPWRGNSSVESAKVDTVWVGVDGDLPKTGKIALVEALKKSGATRGAQLQTRAARMFKVSEDTVEKLRAMGLDFDDVVSCLAAANGSASNSLRAGRWALEGQSAAYIARELRIDSSKIRDGINRFWDLRQE
jgi:hypothetical protein